MGSSRPGTGDDAGFADEAGVEHEDRDDLADDRLPEPARRALVSLLMNRYVSRTRHRIAWEGIVAYESDLRARLDEMYLDLILDREAEVAFKRQQDGDDVPRVLRREKALTRDASFVLIFLRREYAFADPDDGPVVISRDQISEFLRAYREDGDSDDARFSRRVDAAINALIKPWQILEPDPAVDYLFTISPVVVPLVGVDEMRRLEAAFRQAAAGPGSSPSPDGKGSGSSLVGDEDADDRRQGGSVMNTGPAGQYRIEQVQILNWGGYAGLQVMWAGRTSMAILGPSGRGKSTLLDAMASVIMPNPQEFNQAARDDRGRKRERTVYTYARGLTVSHQDDNGRSATPAYLRPPGRTAFISGAAITWSTGAGKRVTAFRLAWVGTDATDNASIGNNTVYGFVHDAFDLTRLDGLKPARSGTTPLSEASMRHLIDPARGDLVDHRQPRMHAALRRALQMGHTEESQRLAMHLLRRAQASKGIFSINDLFKDFVLTEPHALARWDVTLEHYREASRLYDEFELAKTKTETLKELPVVAEQYRSAGRDAADRRALAQPPASGVTRLQVWHASKTLDWAHTYEEDVRLELAQAKEDLQGAQACTREAEDVERDALSALMASGDDQTTLIRERIERAQEKQHDIQTRRITMAARLKAYGQVLPSSSGDLELLRVVLAQQAAEYESDIGQLSQDHETQAGEKMRLAAAIPKLNAELDRVSKQAGNIPHEADQRRQVIADGARIPVERLQYIGELLDIPPEHRGWERAILTIIRPLASDLLVAAEDFPAVRAWVNSHNLGGDITLVPGVARRPVRTHQAGTVAAMLDITPGPYQGWLSEELERFTYLCVEKDTDLDGPRLDGVLGRVTRAGMRTAQNRRVIKADAPRRYRWIGRDNSALRAELEDELDGLRRQFDDVTRQVEIARRPSAGTAGPHR